MKLRFDLRPTESPVSRMRILLVEDDEMIGSAIVQALKDAAYAVDWVHDGESATGALMNNEHDAVLLDLNLPKRDGIEVLRSLRAQKSKAPVLTARDALADRIAGLDAGADDYLTKPFEISELLARLRAVSRRLGDHGDNAMRCGKLTVNAATHMAVYGDTECRLTSREFALMSAFIHRPGTVLSRSQLEQKVYPWEAQVESNAIEVLIHGIRKKLGPSVIRNIRGVGWLVDKEDNR